MTGEKRIAAPGVRNAATIAEYIVESRSVRVGLVSSGGGGGRLSISGGWQSVYYSTAEGKKRQKTAKKHTSEFKHYIVELHDSG